VVTDESVRPVPVSDVPVVDEPMIDELVVDEPTSETPCPPAIDEFLGYRYDTDSIDWIFGDDDLNDTAMIRVVQMF